jgi:Ca2+-binding EF-hand superfamily protein
LIHQIDLDNNGKISSAELMEFLWPKEISQREVGAVIQKIRQALMSSIKFKKNKNLSNVDDVTLIDAFGKLTGAPLLRGNLIEVRSLRKAFAKVHHPALGTMTKYEVDILVTSLDTNCDGVVSAREFRKWLLREEEEIEFPSNLTEEEYHFLSTSTSAVLEDEEEQPEPVTESVAEKNDPQTPLPVPEVEQMVSDPPQEIDEIELQHSQEVVPEIPQDLVENEQLIPIDIQEPAVKTLTARAIPVVTPPSVIIASPVSSIRVPQLPSSSSDPLVSSLSSSQASLNQRKNKTQYGTDSISSRSETKEIDAKDSAPPSPVGGSLPDQRPSPARWIGFFGLGILVLYAVYRGMSSPK